MTGPGLCFPPSMLEAQHIPGGEVSRLFLEVTDYRVSQRPVAPAGHFYCRFKPAKLGQRGSKLRGPRREQKRMSPFSLTKGFSIVFSA